MAGSSLPTIPFADIKSRNTIKSCYVTIGTKVFDITDFIEDHPGGGDLILEYGGRDVGEILKDEVSHSHSESAYEILEDHLIGFVATNGVLNGAAKSKRPAEILPLPPSKAGARELNANGNGNGIGNGKPVPYERTGLSSAEDLSKETDLDSDYKKHKFLDLNKPLLMQVWNGGFSKEFYLDQVHRPRHYRGGASAPLFGNFLEPLSLTPWWVVPIIWLPAVGYATWTAAQGLSSSLQTSIYWVLGLCIWTLVEYGMHRCLFHLDE
jgi:4-hydroxysphinganine ceramide fatty acyl 2-hydroxylase